MKRWKVGLDVDDIIFSCNEYAVELTNSELHLTPPIQMNEITAWGPLGTRADLRLKYFKSKKFFETHRKPHGYWVPVISVTKDKRIQTQFVFGFFSFK